MTLDEQLACLEDRLYELRGNFWKLGRYAGREQIDGLIRLAGGIRIQLARQAQR